MVKVPENDRRGLVVVRFICLMIGLVFLGVGSISVTCAYHHGIDGPEKPQQASSSLFCSSLSQLSHPVQHSSPGYALFYNEQVYGQIIQSKDDMTSLFVGKTLARSPPIPQFFSFDSRFTLHFKKRFGGPNEEVSDSGMT